MPLTLATLERVFVLLTLTRKRVFIFCHAQLVHRYVVFFLVLDVFADGSFIQSYRAHVIAFGSEVPVPELVLQVCVFVEYHQRALPLQVPHHF